MVSMDDVTATVQGHERAVDGDIPQIRAFASHIHAVDIIDGLCEPL